MKFEDWDAEQRKKLGFRFYSKTASIIAWIITRLVYRPWRWIGVRFGWIDEEEWSMFV